MKTQHTPGPWKIESDTFETLNVHTDSINICTVWTQGDLAEEGEANATLIADAPTILSVLEKCFLTLVGEYPKDQWEQYYPEIIEAKALLEKHLGDLGLED